MMKTSEINCGYKLSSEEEEEEGEGKKHDHGQVKSHTCFHIITSIVPNFSTKLTLF